MSKTIHFIVSIGTSVISNYCDSKHNINPTKPAKFGTKNGPFSNDTFPKPTCFESNSSKINECKKIEGAEQKNIRIIKAKKFSEQHSYCYHLISTDTDECLFCASLLGHEVLSSFGTITYYVPNGLGKPDKSGFSNEGLPALLSCVAKILDNVNPESEEAVIVPTGGYKAIIPYLTMASILYNVPAYYVYEESDELIELPVPPLSVNTASFRPAIFLLENVIDLNKEAASPYLDVLPDSFQKLVYLNKDGTYSYTAFGDRLKKLYKSQTPSSPLITQVGGNKLLNKLDGYKDTFLTLIKLGETVWLGDKAPEMAEHAQYHHSNLFAYAELLLLPILSKNQEFLSAEELFLLLGIVYLHDCGHSSSSIVLENGGNKERIPLLPTEIRNFHNLLGYQRLKDKEFQNTIQTQASALKEEFFTIVAGLSAYHRKKMPMLNGIYYGPGKLEFKALETKDMAWGGQSIKGSLLISLFRIIDGMDKQVARNGDAIEVSMKAEAIYADLDNLWNRVCLLEGALSKLDNSAKAMADTIFEKIIEEYGKKEQSATTTQGKCSKKCNGWTDECNNPTHSLEGGNESASYLELKCLINEELFAFAWEYLHARTRFFFHAIQPSYYYSDMLLDMPKVTYSVNNDDMKITINYCKSLNEEGANKIQGIWDKIQGWFVCNLNGRPEQTAISAYRLTVPEQVVEGIRDEYCSMKKDDKKYNTAVAQILKKNKIVLEFQFNGVPVSCCRS